MSLTNVSIDSLTLFCYTLKNFFINFHPKYKQTKKESEKRVE